MNNNTKSLPVVTVIIPTIGRPDYIVDTVRSVLAQSYLHLQILISDNAPEVATKSLLRAASINDPRIEIIQHTKRLEFSDHMNKCIALSNGEYLMILSDDDQIAPSYVADMVAFMLSNNNIKICFGNQIRIDENCLGLFPVKYEQSPLKIFDGLDFLIGSLSGTLTTNIMTYVSMFVRRTDIIEVGGFRPYPDGSHADNFVVLSLALRGLVALGGGTMFYRVYLASFGLRTPFSALLSATNAYTNEALALTSKAPIKIYQRKILDNLIKRTNARMLLSRIRAVYRFRLSIFELLICLLRTLQFRFGLYKR